jgi:hypothetical protein
MLFGFWSDVCELITCQDFIPPELIGEVDILSWHVIYPHNIYQSKTKIIILLPFPYRVKTILK